MNNLLYLKKMTQQQAHEDLSAKHQIDETEDFNRWVWKYLRYIFAGVIIIGMGVWVAETYACGEIQEPEVEIRVINL